jgi:hypothetical protein
MVKRRNLPKQIAKETFEAGPPDKHSGGRRARDTAAGNAVGTGIAVQPAPTAPSG